jgi:Domain of unknown function (DUF4388)
MPLTGDFSEFRFVDIMPFFETNALAFATEWLPGEGELVMYISRGEVLHAQAGGVVLDDSGVRDAIRLLFTRPDGRFAVRRVPQGVIPKSMRVNIGAIVLKTSAEFDEFMSGRRSRPMPEAKPSKPPVPVAPPVPVRPGFWGQVREFFGAPASSRAR